MKLGIRLHLAGLSFSDTISVLERFGVDRCRSTVHNWIQKADLQPIEGADPDHVAVDETVIQLDTERYWLYAAVDTHTNRLLYVRLFPTRTQALSEMFLSKLRKTSRRRCSLSRRFSALVAGSAPPPQALIPAGNTRESDPRRTCLQRGKTLNQPVRELFQPRPARDCGVMVTSPRRLLQCAYLSTTRGGSPLLVGS